MVTQLIEVYLDCPIYYVTPPDVPRAIFRSPCIFGDFTKRSAVKKRICQSKGGTWDGTSCSISPPPEPPPAEVDHIEGTYNGVDIWHRMDTGFFTAAVAPGYSAVATNLPDIRVSIDEILAFLNPPEDPESGLFAQIIAEVQTWVMALMPGWVMEWGENIYNTVNNITENISNIYNDLRQYVTNVYNTTEEYITEVYNTFNDYVTNVYNYVTEEITNVFNTTSEYVTNIIGVTSDWVDARLVDMTEYVDSRIALLDPTNFLANPPEYISGVFSLLGLAKETKMIESFLAGLEEGLSEETEE